MSLTEECEKVTGIQYVMRAHRREAEKILAQKRHEHPSARAGGGAP